MTPALVDVRGLVKHFPGERRLLGLGPPRAVVRAVDDVSFAIAFRTRTARSTRA